MPHPRRRASPWRSPPPRRRPPSPSRWTPSADYKLPHGFQTADRARATAEPPAPSQDFRTPDTKDYAEGRGTYNAPEVVVVNRSRSCSRAADGMDWADIGLGAGSVMGLALIALGGGVLIVRRRGAQPVAG